MSVLKTHSHIIPEFLTNAVIRKGYKEESTVFKGKNKEICVYGMIVYVENLKEFTKKKKKK